jgi:hypothetical protein
MAAILPFLKAVLPHVSHIASIAIPAFTKKPPVAAVDPIVARQIEELQAAATHNAESIHVLAENLEQSIEGINQGAITLQAEIVRLRRLVFVALSLAALSLMAVGWLTLNH